MENLNEIKNNNINNDNGKVKKVNKMNELNKVENGNSKEALKVVKLNGLDKFESLINFEATDSDYLQKPFNEMDEKDLSKVRLCRAKVLDESYPTKNGKVSKFTAYVEIAPHSCFVSKILDDNELRLIQLNQPDLINAKDLYVPVKLYAFKTKDNRYAYKYVACLTNGVYIGNGNDRNGKPNGYFNSKELTLLVSYNATHEDKVVMPYISIEKAKSMEIDVVSNPFED
ncbi:MAG: hypothetical protein ACI35W_05470 [Anaeroplasmataceae bacterium]